LDLYEFSKAIKDYMLGFTDSEIRAVFAYFDYDRSGSVSYDEFLQTIRGPLNASRKKLVAQAYNKLDKDGSGWIDINDIKGVYTAKTHPDVLAGRKSEEQILLEFLETFETHHSLRNNGAPDHVVTREEFDEYYANISASIDNDQYFELMMNNAWKINDGDRTYAKGWANKSETSQAQGFSAKPSQSSARVPAGQRPATAVGQSSVHSRQVSNTTGYNVFGTGKPAAQAEPVLSYNDKQVVEQFRTKLAARGARGIIGLGKQFKIADDDNSRDLDLYEFKKAVRDFRINLNEKDAERLFKIFDRDGSGRIDYEEFLRGVRGEMNQFRANIAKRAFQIMDKDRSGVLSIDDIRQTYNAK
jgi:calcyphosin